MNSGRFRAGLLRPDIGLALSAHGQGLERKPVKNYEPYVTRRELSGPEPLPRTRVYPSMDQATVSVCGVRGSIARAVEDAVEAAGGLAEIESGQRVLIKPSMVGPALQGLYPGKITTNPEVLAAVIRLVKKRGARVLVGDRGFFARLSFWSNGYYRVCRQEGAEPHIFPYSDYVRFTPGKRHWSQGFRMPIILNEIDHFINVPILKNHEASNAEFTGCLKSFVGICHPKDRFQKGADALHALNISEKIVELNLCARPLINIVDATTIMVRGGPGSGIVWGDPFNKVAIWVKAGLILASKDRVACDSVALSALKLHATDYQVKRSYVDKSVWDQVQIYYAAELGLGQADPKKITIEDVHAPRFDEIKANWK